MKFKLPALALSLVMLTSCQDAYRPAPTEKVIPPYKQVIFGHLGSFMVNPDILYKLENNTIYTTHRQATMDMENLPAFYPVNVSDSLRNAVETLFAGLPSALTNNTSHSVGVYFPDVGYSYISVSKGEQIQYWYLQATLPAELNDFSKSLMGILAKLE